MENGLTPKNRRLLKKLPFMPIHLNAIQWRTSGTKPGEKWYPNQVFQGLQAVEDTLVETLVTGSTTSFHMQNGTA